jgi:hypothetical protein
MNPLTNKKSLKDIHYYIYAVDFDGTLVEDDYPNIGIPTKALLGILKLQKINSVSKWILWTCRSGESLTKAVEFCKNIGLRFDAINENLPEIQEIFGTDTRKVYADFYIDDKSKFPEDYE